MGYALLLTLAGMLQGVMVSLNGQLNTYFDPFTVAFFVHSIPTVLLILYLKVYRHAKIFAKASVPAYVFAVGLMGLSIVSISSYVTARIGAVASGFFGVDRRPFRWKELPCYLLAVAGTVLIVTG